MPGRAKTELSREAIVERALAIADAEGLEAVTIRRVALEFGVTPMALYWHVQNKDELLAGIGDRVLDSVRVPDPTGDWPTDLRTALVELVTAMRPHPQLAELVAERMLQHPHGRDLTEIALRTLSDAGFAPAPASYLAMLALRTAIALVTGDQVDDSGMTAEQREEQQRHKTAMIRSLPPRQYPALVAHAEAMTYCSDVDLFFDLGIDHYIAGVTGMAPGAR